MDDNNELDIYDVNCDNINEILLKKKSRTLFLILTVLKAIFPIKLRMEEFIQIMLSMLRLSMATPWSMKSHTSKFLVN